MARHYNSPFYYEYLSFPPLHLCFFVIVLFLFLSFSWYLTYESMFEDFMDQFKLLLIASPLVLLLVVHCLSSQDRQHVPFVISLPDKDSLHRAGGSPWGVAVLLVFLLYMISYQSYFHESWFPFVN